MSQRARFMSKLVPILIAAVFVVAVAAQNQQPPAPRPTPPDQKAFMDANALKDPAQKIEALERLMKEFPKGTYTNTAQQTIITTLIRSYPDQRSRILEYADRYIASVSDAQKPAILGNLAGQFFEAGILMDEAEKYAVRSLELSDRELATAKANPAPQPVPAVQGNAPARAAAPNPQANIMRARIPSQLALGRIYLKQGKLEMAERYFKEVQSADPAASAAQLATATLGLAELYERQGNNNSALENYIAAAASSKIPVSARQALNALYAKTHKGAVAGLEEMLDAKYLELNPPPFEVARYAPTATRTDRVVLAEVFTGAGCPPCVAADLAADLAMERYGTELAVIMYHEHIPQPDPMTTPQTTARFKYYAGTGVPTLAIDGVAMVGGGARAATKAVYERITKAIEKQLEVPAEANLKLDARRSGTIVRAKATVDKIVNPSLDLRLHIVLVEGKLRYTGENGIRFHPMVVRSMAGPEGTGFEIKPKDSTDFDWDFDLLKISAGIKQHLNEYEAGGHRGNTFTFTEKKYTIDPKDLLVVAFVQDAKTRAILQTISLPIKP